MKVIESHYDVFIIIIDYLLVVNVVLV